MTKLRIELSKSDVQKIVLEHITESYNLRENGRLGRVYDGITIEWTEDGGLIFERDDASKIAEDSDPKKTWSDWKDVVDDNGKHF